MWQLNTHTHNTKLIHCDIGAAETIGVEIRGRQSNSSNKRSKLVDKSFGLADCTTWFSKLSVSLLSVCFSSLGGLRHRRRHGPHWEGHFWGRHMLVVTSYMHSCRHTHAQPVSNKRHAPAPAPATSYYTTLYYNIIWYDIIWYTGERDRGTAIFHTKSCQTKNLWVKFRNHCAEKLVGALRKPTSFV